MKNIVSSLGIAVLVGVALAAGYWWGSHKDEGGGMKVESAGAIKMDSAKKSERKILYYRNPMGLPDTSPTPKKDQMGMDYIAVYEGEEPAADVPANTVKIGIDKVQKLGVKTEAAGLRELTRTVRAVGTVQLDERQVYTVAPKFEGWIERLHVNTTGQYVKQGDALMEVYSPDLVTAQQEYIIAWKGVESVKDGSPEIQASMRQLVAGALQRMSNWDISEQELQRLQKEGAATRTIILRSPVSGVVLEKPALKGMRFMPGEALYRISDLTSLWLLADIFEQDLALVRQGQQAKIMVNAYPGKVFAGRVAFVYPTVTPETRTAKLRIELANAGGLLKPAMYANVELAAGGPKAKTLAVPDSAVLDSGTRQIVLVQRGEGLFEPRSVKLGMYADGYVEVLEGVKAGDNVVVSANFLIDSESNLKAALSTFGAPARSDVKSAAAPGASPPTHNAQGIVRAVDPQTGKVNIEHGPIASLKWPAMTMDFQVKDQTLLKGVTPGQAVQFELVQEGPGQFVVTRIAPTAVQPVRRTPAAASPKGG
ncbi:MAG: efflux transporter periplasmic adaptor subunit [Betaproteobacteria bacterium RIFCSPLOWO2_12_FULL_62_13b]|nr:MAG: efflux transporter periplasmic adaptor subunit [Betaproteobacteria bacterium RIFCSPLOWO2_12_FULL_62_13b]